MRLQLGLDDQASVVGGCEATLVFPKLEDVFLARVTGPLFQVVSLG